MSTFTDASNIIWRYTIIGTSPNQTASIGNNTTGSGNATTLGTGISGVVNIPGTVNIPDSSNNYTVTTIGRFAFFNCTNLTSVIIPRSVTNIGISIFESCTNLNSINIPDLVTSIGSNAFYRCSKLTSIAIPDLVTSIGASAFSGCTRLTSITIGNNVTSIGASAFSGCTGLNPITIPDNVTSIGASAFYNCSKLTSITIPDKVTSIGNNAFESCSNLTSVTVGTSVTSIGSNAFNLCSKLTSINIPESVTSIGASAFAFTSIDLTVAMHNNRTISGLVFNSPAVNKTFFGNINNVNFVLPPPTMIITSPTFNTGSITNVQTIALTFTSSKATTDFLRGDINFNNGTLSNPLTKSSDTVYTATITPTIQGAYAIGVPAGTFTDPSGTLNVASNTFTFTFDNVSPDLTISSTSGVANGSITNVNPIELRFISTEATNNFGEGGIILTNGTLSSSFTAISPTVYTATFTPTGPGPVACTIDVLAGAYTDAATNLNNLATQFAFTYDSIKPEMGINANVANNATTNNETIELTFTSSKPTTNFVKESITVTNGTLSTPLTYISDTVYKAIFSPNGQGAYTINVAANKFTDAAGNGNTASNTFNWTYDSVSPTMDISSNVISGSTTNVTPIELRFISTEATNNFGEGGIILTNGTLSSSFTAISPTVYTATFTPTGPGPLACTIDVLAGAYTDAATNLNNLATQFAFTYDSVPPTMDISSNVTSGSTTNNETIELTFTSNEATTNFVKENIRVSNGTLSALTTSDNTVYNATFTRINTISEGQCTIDVDAGAYTDAAGNNNIAATTFIWNFETVSPNITITATAGPSNIDIATGATTNYASIELTFTSTEATTGFEYADISVTNGTLGTLTTSDNKVYYATFTPDENGATGKTECSIYVEADKFTDAVGNYNTASNDSTPFTFTFDNTKPTITIESTTVASGATTKNASIELTFILSEVPNGFEYADISVTNGTLGTLTTSDNKVYYATFTPAQSGVTGKTECSISVQADKFTDAVGNSNTASTPFTFTFDSVPPTMDISSNITSGSMTNISPIELTFTSSEPITGFTIDDISFNKGTLSDPLNTISDTIYKAIFTPDEQGAYTIYVPAGSFIDAAGNSNTAATQFAFTYDSVRPTMDISSNVTSGSTTNNETIELTFTSNEATTNFVKEDIRVSNGTLSSLTTTDNKVYYATFTRINTIAEGQCTIDVDAGAYTDAVGNNNIAAETFIWNFETGSPNMTIRARAGPSNVEITSGATTNHTSIELTFTSSEATTNFVKENIRVSNGALSSLTTSDNTVYNATFTRINTIPEGQCTIDVDAGAYTDAAGNNNIAAEAFIWNFETESPNITIIARAGPSNVEIASGATTNNETIELTFTSSEATTNFVKENIRVSNGALSSLTTSDNTVYNATFTRINTITEGQCTIDVDAGAYTDAAGNNNNVATTFIWNFETNSPNMTITATAGPSNVEITSGATTNHTSIELTFTSTEATTNFVKENIRVSNGALSSLTTSDNTVYNATFTRINTITEGQCTIDVDAGAYTDAAGNNNIAATTFIWNFETDSPNMTITARAGPSNVEITSGATTNHTSIELTFTSSEATTNFVKEDIRVSNGTLSALTTSDNKVYNATFTRINTITEGQCTIDVDAGAYNDSAVNNNIAAETFIWNFETESPNITIRATAGPSNVEITSGATTNNETIELTFTSSEATTNFVKENIRVSNGTLSSLTTSDNKVYNATFTRINTITEGQCTIDVDAGAYTDAAGNNNIAATTFIWNFETVSPNITITATAGPSNEAIATGATTNYTPILLTFTLSELPTGFDYADISVTNGTLGTLTTSDNKVYYATFTPDESGVSGKTECSISVPADKFTDAVGNYNTASNDSTPFTFTFDNTKPTMTISSTTVTSGSTTKNTSIELIFTLSEVPTGFEYADISVTNGRLTALTGSDTVYTATFTPDESGVSGKTECSIYVEADKFTDAVGNYNTASNNSTPFTFTFDSVPPTMEIIASASGLPLANNATTNNAYIDLTFTSSESTTEFVESDISVTNGQLTNFSGSGAVYTATFTPTGTGACTIDVAAGAFTDAAGNTNTAATRFNLTFRRTVSFDTNTLTIVNSIGTNATDLVLFVLPSGEEMSNINVTAFTGTGTITYDLSTDGESVSSGTFTGTGTNLLGTNVLIASTNTTYILTLVANASLTYTIVGTKRVNYGNVPPTALSFVNNTLTIKNSIVSADVDKVSFDVNAGSILDSLVVTSLLNTNSISYALDISGGSTLLSGSFTEAGVNLLNRSFIAPTVKTSYILTLTCGGTNTYSIVGMSQEKSEIDKFCSRHGIPCNNVGYNRLVTSTNNPSVSNKMRYSQLLRSRRFKPIQKIGTSVPPPKPEVPLYLFATGQIFAQSVIFPESLI